MFLMKTLKKIYIVTTAFTISFLLLVLYYKNWPFGKSNPAIVTHSTLSNFLVAPKSYNYQVSQLQNLRALQWPQLELAPHPAGRTDVNGTIEPLPKAFEPVMSRGQRDLAKHLLKLFSDIMFEQGWGNRWLLYGGTLLGSFRHHDNIPWDDDTDVMVDLEIRSQLQQILKSLEPEYCLSIQSKRDKFHTQLLNASLLNVDDTVPELSRKTSEYSWGWPYLDIGYYVTNGNNVCELASSYNRKYCWPRDVIFPLIFRPLGEHWFPTPIMLWKFLKLTYNTLDRCIIFGYSHVLESNGPSGNIPCKQLATRYAFVKRYKLGEQCDIRIKPLDLRTCYFVEEWLMKNNNNHSSLLYYKLRLPQII